MGFEPGTFRSCVEHSIHYAMETPPIPDVLVVLVAPKHIHRNVTTLQSMFTPTPTPRTTLHPKPTHTVRRPSPPHPALFADQPHRPTDRRHARRFPGDVSQQRVGDATDIETFPRQLHWDSLQYSLPTTHYPLPTILYTTIIY